MQHEYFPARIRKQIERSSAERSEATFSGGDFAPDLVNKLKAHLRKIEEAQVRSVQEFKETVRAQRVPGYTRPKGKIWQQIEAARASK